MKGLVLLAWISAFPLAAEDGNWELKQNHDAKDAVPEGVAVELQLPSRAVIGDSIIGQFVVKNAGKKSFQIGTGGDYRGASVPLRLKVRVTDAKGQVLEDLAQYENCFGGLGGLRSLEPGKSEAIECPLQGYVTFMEPGIYMVEAKHDLGWIVQASRPHPVATAKIDIVMPDAEQAATRVRALCAEIENDDKYGGQDRERQWQLYKLQHPVFLPALVEEAKAGRGVACVGIGNIPGVEANVVLLELAKSEIPGVARAAAEALVARLPSLKDATKPAWASFFNRAPRVPIFKSWEARLDGSLMEVAKGLSTHKDVAMVGLGASFIEARGGTEQVEVLLATLQRELNWSREGPRNGPKANVLDPPDPLRQLIRAVDALRERGWHMKNGNGGTAVMLAWFRQVADPKFSRPPAAEWKQSVMAFMDANPSTFRENAIRAIPNTYGKEWDKPLLKALDDEDWGVVRAACEVAGRSGREVFISPLCHIVETIHQNFVQSAAHQAAVTLGARTELWRAWCECITDKERIFEAVGQLARGTIELPEGNGGSSGNSNFSREERFGIRDAWRKFLNKHHDLLERGGRVKKDDPSITPEMLGTAFRDGEPVFRLHLKDGGYWPK